MMHQTLILDYFLVIYLPKLSTARVPETDFTNLPDVLKNIIRQFCAPAEHNFEIGNFLRNYLILPGNSYNYTGEEYQIIDIDENVLTLQKVVYNAINDCDERFEIIERKAEEEIIGGICIFSVLLHPNQILIDEYFIFE